MYFLFFLSVICEIPPWRLTLRHLAPYSALYCGVLADSHNSAPFKNVQFEPPQKPAAAGDVRVTQVEIPSLLGCSISLACDPHTHTGEEGIRPPPPSISTCPLSSILPSILPPPLFWCLVYSQRSCTKLCQTCQIEEIKARYWTSKSKKKPTQNILF